MKISSFPLPARGCRSTLIRPEPSEPLTRPRAVTALGGPCRLGPGVTETSTSLVLTLTECCFAANLDGASRRLTTTEHAASIPDLGFWYLVLMLVMKLQGAPMTAVESLVQDPGPTSWGRPWRPLHSGRFRLGVTNSALSC